MNRLPPFICSRQRGVSLIELMVALVIAALLGIGLVQIFGSTRAAFNANTSLARAQENSRFALGFINEDLRMAGHLGTRNEQGSQAGAAEDPVGNLLFNHTAPADGTGMPDTAPWAFRLDIPFEAYEFNGTGINVTYTLPDPPVVSTGAGNWSPALPSELTPLATTALAGSDIIVVRYLSADFVTLVNRLDRADGMAISSNMPFVAATGTFFWNSASSPDFIKDQGIYAFSNARAISLFQVASSATPVGATEASATASTASAWNRRGWQADRPTGAGGERENSADYGSLLPVHRYEMVVYYVAIGAGGEPALFRRRLNPANTTTALGDPEELVPGVESLQVVMGLISLPRAADQPEGYATANQISAVAPSTTAAASANWRRVVSARVGLLMRSQLPASRQEADITHNVAGTQITPAATDRRLRHVYETQVSLRNRSRG